MDSKIQVIPEDYYECFQAFLKAVDDKNEELINLLIRKEGIVQKNFTEDRVTLLHVTAKRGTVETAIQLCELGADVNFKNIFGETPIFHAAKNSTEMVKLLINNGAKMNIMSYKNVTPLHEALLCTGSQVVGLLIKKVLFEIAEKGNPQQDTISSNFQNIEIIKFLLGHKRRFKLLNIDYPLLILFASKTVDRNILNLVLKKTREYLVKNKKLSRTQEPEELNFQGYAKRTALHYAVREQLPEVVQFLINQGADVNCRTKDDHTPLHYASCLENEEICKILLSHGAEVNPKSHWSENPLFQVCGRSEIKNFLTSGDGYYYRAVPFTTRDRMDSITFNPKIMTLLLKNGADPNVTGDNKKTPLLEACRAGRFEEVMILLESGANIQAVDKKRTSALHYAAYGNSIKLVDLLLGKGFDINVRDVYGYTPLMTAIENERTNSLEIIEFLVDRGADVNSKNNSDVTALHLAVFSNFLDITICLLELGADWRLKYNPKYPPVVDHILTGSSQTSRNILISYIALKDNEDNELGEYINCYVHDGYNILAARDQFNKSKNEINKMKSIKIPYYKLLTLDFFVTVRLIKNDEILRIFDSSKYSKEFPCYSDLLKYRFKRAKALEDSVDKVVDFMTNHEKFKLPILIVEMILSHLRSTDIRVFASILSTRQC